jgi:predicted nucleic acid-binding protein
MIILDTNVISEPDKPAPDPQVLGWLNEQRDAQLYLTTPTIAELAGGGHRVLLRTGSRKYLDRLSLIVDREFFGRILGFELAAADAYGRVRSQREKAGRRVGQIDAMIAAICLVHGATLATRNVRDFEGIGLSLVNPFEAMP